MAASISRRTTFIGFLLCLSVFLVINFLMVAPYLIACVMGGLLAVVSVPFHQWLNRKLGRKWSAILVVLSLVIVVIGPLSSLLVLSIQEAIDGAKALVANPNVDIGKILKRVDSWGFVQQFVGDPQSLQQKVSDLLQKFVGAASGLLMSTIGNLPQTLLLIVLVALTCYFSLVDGAKFLDWLRARLPVENEVREDLFRSLSGAARSTIFGTVLAAAAQAATIAVSFLSLGMPKVLLATGLTFVFACIPLCGSAPVWITATLYLYFNGMVVKAIIMLAAGLFTGIIDNIVRALVLSGESKIHPLVSLLSLFGGIHFFGIWGLFVGPVFTAGLLALLDVWPKVMGALKRMETPASSNEEPQAVPDSSFPTPTLEVIPGR